MESLYAYSNHGGRTIKYYIENNIALAIRNWQNNDFMDRSFSSVKRKLDKLETIMGGYPPQQELFKKLNSMELELLAKKEDNNPEEMSESLEKKYLEKESIKEVFEYLERLDEQTRYIICSYFGAYGYSLKTLGELKNELRLTARELIKIMQKVTNELRKILGIDEETSLKK